MVENAFQPYLLHLSILCQGASFNHILRRCRIPYWETSFTFVRYRFGSLFEQVSTLSSTGFEFHVRKHTSTLSDTGLDLCWRAHFDIGRMRSGCGSGFISENESFNTTVKSKLQSWCGWGFKFHSREHISTIFEQASLQSCSPTQDRNLLLIVVNFVLQHRIRNLLMTRLKLVP